MNAILESKNTEPLDVGGIGPLRLLEERHTFVKNGGGAETAAETTPTSALLLAADPVLFPMRSASQGAALAARVPATTLGVQGSHGLTLHT